MTDTEYLKKMIALVNWLKKLDPMDQDDVVAWDKTMDEMRTLSSEWHHSRHRKPRFFPYLCWFLAGILCWVIWRISC